MVSQSKLRFGKELDKLKIDDIQLLIDNKIDESHNLEYKGATTNTQSDCDNIAVAISSFLNTDGGIVLYGVSETKGSKPKYPNGFSWSNASKEQIESLLVSRVHPWSERIRIHRIKKKNSATQGIFIIEVPKSASPLHMNN